MEEIFIAIMERIAEKMPELSYIDEDYGQFPAFPDKLALRYFYPELFLFGQRRKDT